jgi:hypothetical protein
MFGIISIDTLNSSTPQGGGSAHRRALWGRLIDLPVPKMGQAYDGAIPGLMG